MVLSNGADAASFGGGPKMLANGHPSLMCQKNMPKMYLQNLLL
jgi:hypothetical protein